MMFRTGLILVWLAWTTGHVHAQYVLQFTATWCQPCRQIEPTIARLRAEGCDIRAVDIDQRPDLKASYRVASVPTFIGISAGGKVIGRMDGFQGVTKLRQLCAAAAAKRTVSAGSTGGGEPYRTRNFVVTDDNDQAAPVVAEAAEYFRRQHWLDWFGHEPPGDWETPCTVTVRANNQEGGSTSFGFDGGQAFGFQGTWNCGSRATSTVVPHEVMHTVWASEMGYATPRWLDEGIATSVESPDSQANWWQMAHELAAGQELLPLRELCTTGEYSPRSYAQGVTLVTFLMEQPAGRRGLVALGFEGRSGDWDAAFRSVYRMTPEQVHVAYCGWLQRQPRRGPLFRLIAGIRHRWWERRWQPCEPIAGPLVPVQPVPSQNPTPAPGGGDPWRTGPPDYDPAQTSQPLPQTSIAAPQPSPGGGVAPRTYVEPPGQFAPPATSWPTPVVAPSSAPGPAPAAEPPAPSLSPLVPVVETAAKFTLTQLLLAAGVPTGGATIAALLLWRLGRRGVQSARSGGSQRAGPFADAATVAESRDRGGGAAAADGSFRYEHFDQQPIERDSSEGEQLLRLSALEGRDPLQDAIAGRIIRSRLDTLADGTGDASHRAWARDLRNEINDEFNKIAPTKFTMQAPAT